ncbi:uncharacterized protein [Spinacia oleracea]|uniref:GRF-type domain-containing protein n=1 Tax=Spinacia oleracea TaxID=3562 RepID=A0A9R0IZU5_SPIOL|nr:uncharacterized protein LOC110796546 [Spinacia oleracea]
MSHQKAKMCGCGYPVVQRTSWTHENPGRKFKSCRFYNFGTGQRGCDAFDWVDEDILEWQKDVTNHLLSEKQRLAMEMKIIKGRAEFMEHEMKRLNEEHEKMKVKYEKMRKMAEGSSKIKNEHVYILISLCAIVSVVVSALYVMVFA